MKDQINIRLSVLRGSGILDRRYLVCVAPPIQFDTDTNDLS